MKASDIAKIYNKSVKWYLDNGWIINLVSSGCTLYGGEITKIDLTNGNTVVRVAITSECVRIGTDVVGVDCWILREMVDRTAKPHTRSMFPRWETLSETKYYNINSLGYHKADKGEWFSDDEAFVVECAKKNDARFAARRFPNEFRCKSYRIIPNILPLIRRFPRCKTAHLEDVTSITSEIIDNTKVYRFVVRGKIYYIEVELNKRG